MQGFVGLSDNDLAGVEPWLRFSPAICAAWAAAATWAGSVASLMFLAGMAFLGATLPRHPFDAVYNHGLRHLLSAPPIPRYRAPRRFACAVATVWLVATAAAFALGVWALGRLLGGAFTAVALVPVLTGFCVPSFLYGAWHRHRRDSQPAGPRTSPGVRSAS
jgi:hypothetical protein